MSDAEELRFKAFLSATSAEARDWIAYLEFEEAIREASRSAAMVNVYDAGPEGDRERCALELAFTEILFNALSCVDLGTIIANAHGVGLAVRFGVIDPKAESVDWRLFRNSGGNKHGPHRGTSQGRRGGSRWPGGTAHGSESPRPAF